MPVLGLQEASLGPGGIEVPTGKPGSASDGQLERETPGDGNLEAGGFVMDVGGRNGLCHPQSREEGSGSQPQRSSQVPVTKEGRHEGMRGGRQAKQETEQHPNPESRVKLRTTSKKVEFHQ